jgi:hypothetical protein
VREIRSFSYLEYADLIRKVIASDRYMDFGEIGPDTESFIVLRHDVEFSVERSLQMARLEWMLGIRSSYFFQIRNDAYNLFSARNIQAVREIGQMGHHIGLHVHLGMLDHTNRIRDYIVQDAEAMEKMIKMPIDRFSYHRPSKEVLSLNLKIDGMINTYDEKYFEFRIGNLDKLNIHYLADSRHQWKYGYPDENTISKYPKLQLLIHPDEWTIEGHDTKSNFLLLRHEKSIEAHETFKSECDHFE